ncbi:hypothetical protein AMK59_2266 [Oryctes borbonicus]|uniref:Globin domain-containing protein n=1 Tax=Oryctes borbonicus TaxID=1629725 RepID=A0A0T6BC68_9SCAR|nr:hypothetical protein AMK59_2266 [Oryctes borbonicus]
MDAEKADPVTGLTSQQKSLIQSTFNVIRPHILNVGIDLFVRVLEVEPEHHRVLPFSHIPIADLHESFEFKFHCLAVVYSCSAIIDHLHDDGILIPLMKKYASDLKASIPLDIFQMIHDPLLEALDVHDDVKISEEALEAVRTLLRNLTNFLIDATEEEGPLI